MKAHTKTITFTALLIALGVVLPHALHSLGPTAGAMWLPIHLVALIAGISFGVMPGLAVGALTPLLRFAIMGMPPAPLVWFMMLEVAAYGAVGGLCAKQIKLPRWAALASAQIVGRGVRMLSLFVASQLLGIEGLPAAMYVLTGELLLGLPGVALQWAVIPPTTRLLDKHSAKSRR